MEAKYSDSSESETRDTDSSQYELTEEQQQAALQMQQMQYEKLEGNPRATYSSNKFDKTIRLIASKATIS